MLVHISTHQRLDSLDMSLSVNKNMCLCAERWVIDNRIPHTILQICQKHTNISNSIFGTKVEQKWKMNSTFVPVFPESGISIPLLRKSGISLPLLFHFFQKLELIDSLLSVHPVCMLILEVAVLGSNILGVVIKIDLGP